MVFEVCAPEASDMEGKVGATPQRVSDRRFSRELIAEH